MSRADKQTVERIRKEIKARVERHREAKRASGLAPITLWVHPQDHESFRRLAKRKAALRGVSA